MLLIQKKDLYIMYFSGFTYLIINASVTDILREKGSQQSDTI